MKRAREKMATAYLSFPDEEWAAIKGQAAREGISASELIRRSVRAGLDARQSARAESGGSSA
jgi:hypothetical protein